MADYSKIKWKELFAARILSRGYDYYLEGNVWNLHSKDGEISATVAGTEDYCVTITLSDGKITDMVCDCPYAADGNYCKHEAAVLYALTDESDGIEAGACEEQEIDDEHTDNGHAQNDEQNIKTSWLSKIEAEREELKQYLSCMSEDEMRDMLYQLACNDESLRNRIAAMYSNEIDEELILKMRKMVDNIEYEHSDRSGFIDWRHASDFISDLIEFLFDNVKPLIDRGMLEEAFELTCYVFLTIGNAEIDDDGDIAIGAGECCEFWKEIVQKASDVQQERMFDWFSSHIGNGSVYDYMEDYLEDFRMCGFHSRPLLRRRLIDLDDMIARDEQNNRQDPTGWGVYKLGEHILSRVQTMKELEMQKEDVLKFMEKYTYLPRILLTYADEIYSSGDREYAAAVLQKGKERDKEKSGVVREYSCKLIDFYYEQGLKDELVAELKYQISNCSQRDLQYINMLKKSVDEAEWISLREGILRSEKCSDIRLDLLKQEGQLDMLMEEIKRRKNIAILDKYERDLRKVYGKEIRDIYANYVRGEMLRASSRNRYNHIIQDLRKIRRYEGGRELASDIAEKWKAEYPRRSAMLDELRKAGF